MSRKKKLITLEINERGCHICTSHAFNAYGYPVLWRGGKSANMHRVLYEESRGVTLPSDVMVRHRCDERRCINLDHLEEGSHYDNIADRVERMSGTQIGETHSFAILTDVQAAEIRASEGKQHKIASAYGVHPSTVSRIKQGKRRKNGYTQEASAQA